MFSLFFAGSIAPDFLFAAAYLRDLRRSQFDEMLHMARRLAAECGIVNRNRFV
jgi:hypothetical protein